MSNKPTTNYPKKAIRNGVYSRTLDTSIFDMI